MWFRIKKSAFESVRSGVALCAIAFLAFFIAAMPSTVLAQEVVKAKIETETDRGFGRFSITLPERTRFMDYDISTDDNVIVLRLSNPIQIDLRREVIPLEEYILVARQDPEGTVLRFALAAGVRVNTIAAGEHLYIDFLPRNWRGENPSIPEEIVRKLEERAEEALALAEQGALLGEEAENKAKLDVRVGRHPTFTRFVFSWNVPYKSSFKRDDKSAIVIFDQLSPFDFGPINADLPNLVRRVDSEFGDDEMTITLRLSRGAKVRSYVDGSEYIIDVTSDTLKKKAAQENRQIQSPFVIGGLPELPDGAKNVSQTVSSETGEREVAELPKAENPVNEPSPKTVSNEVKEPEAAQSDREREERPQPEQNARKNTDAPKQDVEQNEPRRDAPNQSASNQKNPERVDAASRKVKGLSVIEASINEAQDALRLVFPFDQKTSSAIFRRGKSVWMVFKTDDVIDTSAVNALRGEFVRQVEVIENGQYKAVRIILPSAQLASAAIDENSWVISIGNSVIRASEPLTITRQLNDEGIFLSVPLKDAVGDVVFEDPAVGDRIHVVVADPPARGLIRKQKFVMLTVLPSTHALAFVPISSAVKARIIKEGVAIVSDGNLNLSAIKGLRASPSGEITTDDWFDEALEIQENDIVRPDKFAARERGFIRDIIEASDELQPERHIALAQFYIANGYGPEALASLKRAVNSQPLLLNKRAYVLSKAAAELKMNRNDDALKTLSGETYEKDQDAAVWRTIAASGKGKWALAIKNAALGRTRLSSYDSSTQQDFFLSAATAALNLKDFNNAKSYLGSLVLRNASEFHRGRYEILQGMLAVDEGRLEDARFFFDRAIKVDDIRIQAEAKLNLIKLDHDVGTVDNHTTIDKYEKFVAVWRNDDLELRALRGLGQVLAEEEEYRKAFQLVQTAVISDNDSPITHALQDDMKKLFVELFHGGKADVLPPIDALSLYYDFRHLTPIGRIGDEIVRYLSRRLIDLDLLPQAAELLTHQVDKRLKGPARARVAADLAVVELLDNEPHRAITTLHKSRSAGLPIALQRQRRLVEAYALSEIGKYDIALELLESLDGEDVDRLRANINWDARRWSAAGELLEKTHSGRWADVEPLEPHIRLDIMRAAIAFSLAKDDFALNRLNQKFGQKMSESPDAAIFQVLTQPLDEQNFDRDVAVDSILNIGTADSFLRDYRKRYLTLGVRRPDA